MRRRSPRAASSPATTAAGHRPPAIVCIRHEDAQASRKQRIVWHGKRRPSCPAFRFLLLAQLILPAQQPGARRRRFGFEDISLALIEDREAGMGENVLRMGGNEFTRSDDGIVELSSILQ